MSYERTWMAADCRHSMYSPSPVRAALAPAAAGGAEEGTQGLLMAFLRGASTAARVLGQPPGYPQQPASPSQCLGWAWREWTMIHWGQSLLVPYSSVKFTLGHLKGMLKSHSDSDISIDIWFFNTFKNRITAVLPGISSSILCVGFPTPCPHSATKCMILNKEQLSLTWLYFLTSQRGCESELMFLKHFAWKIIAAAYRFACYSSSFWLMHFCAPYSLCVCHYAVLAFTKACFIHRTLSENRGQAHILTISWPKDQVPAAHFMPCVLLKCLAAVHGLLCFSEEFRGVDSVAIWANYSDL